MGEYQPHPLRVQRKRTKGYRMPPDVVYVGRPGPYGNPYLPEECAGREQGAVDCFRVLMETVPENIEKIQRELKGKRLACWCSLDKPCHADVLAEIANR